MYLQVTFLSGIKNRNLIVFTGQYYGGYVKMCKISFYFYCYVKATRYNRELIESIPSAQTRSADLTIILMRAEWDRRNASLVTNIL